MNKIRKANINDIPRILEIVEEARIKIIEDGFKQWSKESNYPNYNDFLIDINNNNLYVIESEKVEGFMALINGHDENYDDIKGKWLNNTNNYATIHRLAISSSTLNKGLAKELINYAINISETISIRIDTHPKNFRMNNLARRMGFTYCGEIHIKNLAIDSERNAFELILTKNC